MQQEFEERRAIQPVFQFWTLHQMGGAGPLDGRIYLGGIEMEIVGHLKIRGPIPC